MSEDAIRVEHLSKEYHLGVLGKGSLRGAWSNRRKDGSNEKVAEDNQKFMALDDVSFTVPRGEALGVVGGNGAGKSTLLKILSGITTPSKGRIEIYGRSASLLEVGTGFHPEMTGRENIYMNGAILGMKKQEIDEKFDDIVEFAEVEKFIDTPVKRYSSGMYVRLAFAVAAHLNPDILIVDEVLAVGDARFQKKSLGKMGAASKEEGRTVLFVSHNLNAIRKLCQNSIWLDKGRMVGYGPTKDILAAYMEESSAQNDFETSWPDKEKAPQNDTVRLNRLYLGNAQRDMLEKLVSDDEFFIYIDFELVTPHEKAGFTVNLYTGSGELAFSSLSNRHPWYEGTNPKGRYLTSCRIPGKLLNSGDYLLGVNLYSQSYVDYGEYKDLLTFTVRDGRCVRGDYVGPMEGVFRPDLKWETIPL